MARGVFFSGWSALDFDAATDKYAIGFGGLKQALAIYGLSVDQTLDSVRLSELSRDHDHAVVRIDSTLSGKPLSTESRLVRENGRWYSRKLLENVRQSHQPLAQPSVAKVPVPAASVVGTD